MYHAHNIFQSRSYCRPSGNVFATSAFRCSKQCIAMTSGCCAFTLVTNPLVQPKVAAAPSVLTHTQFCHLSPFWSKWSDTTGNISSAVVYSSNSLQNRKFSLMPSLSTKCTFARSCARLPISIDASSCKANFQNALFNICRHVINVGLFPWQRQGRALLLRSFCRHGGGVDVSATVCG